ATPRGTPPRGAARGGGDAGWAAGTRSYLASWPVAGSRNSGRLCRWKSMNSPGLGLSGEFVPDGRCGIVWSFEVSMDGWAWCPEVGDVVASQRVDGDPRRDGAGGQGGVPQGLPGAARARCAWRAVHRRAVRRVDDGALLRWPWWCFGG